MTSEDRRAALLAAHTINGVDFVEVDPNDPTQLDVHFVLNLPGSPHDPVPPVAGDALTAANFRVEGGERITSISVLTAVRTADDTMHLTVDQAGDFSLYQVVLTDGAVPPGAPPGFDPVSASAEFVFHIDCVKDVDCAAITPCPPDVVVPPPINYLAKDYPGFVQTMLDRMALLAPRWQERNAADLGVALVETLAYVADHLSYRQDVIATEAYLGTARLRTSIRRHARLVDYRIGEGVNARVWLRVLLGPSAADGLVLPQGTRCATSYPGCDPAVLGHDTATYQQAVDASAVFFETVADSDPLSPSLTQMPLYAWSDTRACLPVGATSATLKGSYPKLASGMVIVLAEAKGALSGVAADADPAHRQAVRLISAHVATDPIDGQPVTEIAWYDRDALTFALPIAAVTDAEHGAQPVTEVAVAWGNVVLADHGRRVGDAADPFDPNPRGLGLVPTAGRFRPVLPDPELTFATPPPPATDAASAADTRDHPAPVITAHSVDLDGKALDWSATDDLLDVGIGPASTVFLAEIETDGQAYLLFGDGTNGTRPEPGAKFSTSYRVGNGTAGNCAREAITLLDRFGVPAGVTGVLNPMPAWGGVDPESVESVRQHAPVAFRALKLRCVTPQDYAERATQYPGVKRAAATLRWTGSWHTVFVSVERDHQLAVDQQLVDGLKQYLDSYRMAGMDVEVAEGTRVPLHVAMSVCVNPDYVAADVEVALLTVFSTGTRPDSSAGQFNPDRLDLGAPFYLSPLIAAAQEVEGVTSVQVTAFERLDKPSTQGLTAGVLVPQRLEFFVLDNDPNFPERGRFELTVEGGL
jgi:hypothetical protein